MSNLITCPQCEWSDKDLALTTYRGQTMCRQCKDYAENDNQEMRGRYDSAPVDLQREMSEGCLDEYSY